MRALVLCAALAAGCFSPTLQDDIACGPAPGLDCPPDYQCGAGNRCVKQGSQPIVDASVIDAPPAACDPINDTGCPGGKKCVVGGTGAGAGTPRCVTPGSGTQGGICTESAGSDSCLSKFACLTNPTGSPTCHRLCDPAGGTACPMEAGRATFCYPIGGGFGACSLPCDAFGHSDCPAALGCFVGSPAPLCATPGSIQPGQPCNAAMANSCAKGSSCLSAGGTARCFFHCRVGGGAPACSGVATGGSTCSAPSGLTGTPAMFGLCI